jgi:hypothetical protein
VKRTHGGRTLTVSLDGSAIRQQNMIVRSGGYGGGRRGGRGTGAMAAAAAAFPGVFSQTPTFSGGGFVMAAPAAADSVRPTRSDGTWQHDKYQYQRMNTREGGDLREQLATQQPKATGSSHISTGTQVLVMNLDPGVSQSDM